MLTIGIIGTNPESMYGCDRQAKPKYGQMINGLVNILRTIDDLYPNENEICIKSGSRPGVAQLGAQAALKFVQTTVTNNKIHRVIHQQTPENIKLWDKNSLFGQCEYKELIDRADEISPPITNKDLIDSLDIVIIIRGKYIPDAKTEAVVQYAICKSKTRIIRHYTNL